MLSRYLPDIKAVLSQFANKVEDNGPQPANTPGPHAATTHQAHKQPVVRSVSARGPGRTVTTRQNQGTDCDSDGSGSSDSDDDEECDDDADPPDVLDQDEDVIRAAEEAQQEDLDAAEEMAETEVMVVGSEQKAASTALSKVSCSIHCPKYYLLIAQQLTKLAYKINNSPGLVEELEALCIAAKIEPLRMIKPVDTRWNSKSHMIARAIHLRPAIEDICSKKSLVAQYKTRPLKLKREEWDILEQLSPLLGVCTALFFPLARRRILIYSTLQAFHDISIKMQEAGVPLISSVIPCIDQLVDAIDRFKDNIDNHAVVRSAAIRGLTILNKYYQKSDESYVYRIAMGWSHPTSLSGVHH